MKKFLGQTISKETAILWVPRIIVVIVIGQTLPFKFLGAEESVRLFSMINWEPYGRIGIALIETTAVILLLSSYYIIGALISLSIISAASFLHFVKLGFIVNDDGGFLFAMSVVVVVCSLWIVIQWNRTRPSKIIQFEITESEDGEEELLD